MEVIYRFHCPICNKIQDKTVDAQAMQQASFRNPPDGWITAHITWYTKPNNWYEVCSTKCLLTAIQMDIDNG